jgi:hypothetical protein
VANGTPPQIIVRLNRVALAEPRVQARLAEVA